MGNLVKNSLRLFIKAVLVKRKKNKIEKLVLGVKSSVLLLKSWYLLSNVGTWGKKFSTMVQKLVLEVKSLVLWFKSWYFASKGYYYILKVGTKGQKLSTEGLIGRFQSLKQNKRNFKKTSEREEEEKEEKS